MHRVLRLLCLCVSLCLLTTAMVAQQPTRPAITGIAFFRDFTTHPAEAQKFYGPTMGFAQMTAPNDAGMWVYPVNRSQWIEVVHEGQPPSATSRMLAVGFTTRDVRAMEKYLNARGVTTAEPLKNGEFAVRDPEGNLVYFVQSPYGGGAGRLAGVALRASESHPLPTATSVRMIHVGFIVQDRAKEDPFWRGILGFRPYWHGSAKDGTADDYVSLQVPDGTDWLEYMLNQHNPDLRQTGVMDHFSLGTPRMQEVLARLQANGCEGKMCTSIQAGRDGKIQLNLYDPDETRIEYMEFTPAMKPCCSGFTGTQPGLKESE